MDILSKIKRYLEDANQTPFLYESDGESPKYIEWEAFTIIKTGSQTSEPDIKDTVLITVQNNDGKILAAFKPKTFGEFVEFTMSTMDINMAYKIEDNIKGKIYDEQLKRFES